MLNFLCCVLFELEFLLDSLDRLVMNQLLHWVVIARRAVLHTVVMSLRVSAHRDLPVAAGALEVESEHLDAEVIDVIAGFFAHVELCAAIEEVSTLLAADTHR